MKPRMLDALSSLTRDDALFNCARVNTIATGFDVMVSPIERQRRLVNTYCDPEQIAAINAFAQKHGGISNVAVFFRGQMLELARWIAKHCRHDPTDGETFNDPKVRSAFVRAALIASDLWNQRVYADRLKPTDDPDEQLRRALGPFRKEARTQGRLNIRASPCPAGGCSFPNICPPAFNAFPGCSGKSQA